MGKEINYKLNYRDKGEKKSIDIKIDFVSRGIIRDYENMTKDQDKLREKWNRLKDVDYLIEDYKKEKPKDWKIEIKKLYDESNELSKEIISFDKDKFAENQYHLLKLILIDNGIKDGILHDENFWEYKVEVNDMLDFITAVIYKDIDLKKKQ